jgi:hypothetical protein
MRKTIFATLAVALVTLASVRIQGFAESPRAILTAAIPSSGAIMGQGKLSRAQLADILLTENQTLDAEFTRAFSGLYIQEAAAEGVNHDVAFYQMCRETNFLKFDGLVTKESNNFGGIGVVDERHRGVQFPSAQIGVRAQIQHLKGFASREPLAQARVDPRYFTIYHGSAPSIYKISGLGSTELAYGENLRNAIRENGKESGLERGKTQLALR